MDSYRAIVDKTFKALISIPFKASFKYQKYFLKRNSI